ncbi:MAG: phosphotransferase [Acidimicrobiales bacterium]|jgi:aminoglycoside phosphotransferase (APT) family kinase protein
MIEPGALIASGRDADIFEYGHGRVLRRSRNGRSMATEARTMEFVRTRGYPAPRVFDVSDDGLDLVMERVDGTTMVDAGASHPWRLRAMGRELAGLHELLHRIAAPDWVPAAPVGTGDRLLHMDLHPLNVLMGPDGPVVIDWANAARGEPTIDVAVTWVLVASGQVPTGRVQSAVLGIGRRILLGSFLGPIPMDALRSTLAEVVEWKCADPNMSAGEIDRMRSLR